MTREEQENALHCLKVMIDEEVCEECNLYGTTGTDHCEADCVRVAIEALKEHQHYKDLAESYEKTINKLTKAIAEQASSSEEPNKWISVSEATPIIGQDVLVCDVDGEMYITYLHTNGTWGFDYGGNKIKNVVAWQELPELPSYVEESEDNND